VTQKHQYLAWHQMQQQSSCGSYKSNISNWWQGHNNQLAVAKATTATRGEKAATSNNQLAATKKGKSSAIGGKSFSNN